MTLSSNSFPADPIANIIFWIDPEGRILDASDGACRALGYDRETLLTLSVRDVDAEFPSDRWPDHWRELRQAKTLHFRTTHRRRDGSLAPVEVAAHHVELAGREHICALVRELTPQRQTEIALRESEERLALALAVSGQGLYDLDITTGQTVFSDEYARMLGYEPSELELTPATWASWLHPEDRERLLRLFEDCVTGKRSDYRAEFRLRTRSGEWVWVLSVGKIVRWDAIGRPLRMVGTHLDITDRKRTENALRESEERFAKAFHASPAPMAISIIETGRFLDVNEQWLKMLGYTSEETIGRTSIELSIWADPGTRERMTARLRADGFFREAPVRFRTKTGAILDALWSAEIIRLGEQEVMLSLIYDITDRKRAEAELERHREHLEELVAERTAALRQAMIQLVQSEKLAALGSLVAGIAHELNTPLGNARTVAGALGEEVRAFAAAVESGALRRSQVDAFLNRSREAVDLMERNATRAADLIGHFKQVAVDQTSMRRRRFLLRRTVEELLATLQPQFKRTAHRVELDIPPDLELDSYPGPLEQVLANLVDNSLTHGFAGVETGVIRIHAASPNAVQVHIDYTDNGVGVPEKILKRIFEPFFTTQLGSGGSGLGLYIVYNLVTSVLGGTIQSHSVVGQGIRFTLVLPRIGPDQPVVELPV